MPRRKKTRKRRKKLTLTFVGARDTPKGIWTYWKDKSGKIVRKFRRVK